MNSSTYTLTHEEIIEKGVSTSFPCDFSALLRQYQVSYRPSQYYWQVGQINHVQGWIIHLTVIHSQLPNLLQKLLPTLISSSIPFKIVRDSDTAGNILDGNLGYINLGKLISIYPENDAQALELAKNLIALTRHFSGPAIPTDF